MRKKARLGLIQRGQTERESDRLTVRKKLPEEEAAVFGNCDFPRSYALYDRFISIQDSFQHHCSEIFFRNNWDEFMLSHTVSY